MKRRRLAAVAMKELRQIRGDRVTLTMILSVPVLYLLMFGYAINTNIRNLPTGIVDEASTASSRALVMDMLATGIVSPTAVADTPQTLTDLLRRGDIRVGIVVPHDFERRVFEGREAVQVIVDGSDPTVQSAAAQLAQTPIAGSPVQETAGRVSSQISVVGFYNPQRITTFNVVPGLIGVILTMTMVLFTAIAIVRERERGHMELLIATPISGAELMIGKIVPYVGIGLIQTSVVVALGIWLFDVPIRGSILAVYAASLLLIVANLALGLLISTRAKTQLQAMQLTFFVFVPSLLLSGFMFPFSGMPLLAQWLAELLPLTHFLRLVRGVMLRGADLSELSVELLALLGFGLLMMTLAISRFRKRLD